MLATHITASYKRQHAPANIMLPTDLHIIADSPFKAVGGFTLTSVAVFAGGFVVLWLSGQFGARVLGRRPVASAEGGEDFRMILGATLSLLGLIIGFTLSMAIGGFNGRQAGEEAEAEAIRTAYLRADLLPGQSRRALQDGLLKYLDERVRFYEGADPKVHAQTRQMALRLQDEIWTIVSSAVMPQTNPVTALVIVAVNDVLNSQQKTYAGWRTQIPIAAWMLLGLIAVVSNVLVGYNARRVRNKEGLLLVLPLTIALAFLVIAEIDLPGRGVIRVSSVNLESIRHNIEATLNPTSIRSP